MAEVTKFSTALGDVQIAESGVVVMNILVQEITMDILHRHYEELEKQLVKPKHRFVLTFEPTYLKMNAQTRRYNNDMMNYWSISMGVVVDQPLIRAFANMYIRISPLDYHIKLFPTTEEAEKWVLSFD